MIAMIYENIHNTILSEEGSIDPEQLARLQWAEASIISNPDLYIVGVPTTTSVGDPDFDTNYVTKPEYAFYVDANGGNSTDYISSVDVQKILEQNVESYQSLLNSDNMRAFYSMYEIGNYDEIMTRFEFTNKTQIPFMYNYIEHMIEAFLCQGSSYQNIALGSLM